MNASQQDLQLTGGSGRAKRRELDFYPTPRNVTFALMNFLQLPLQRVIWEPACGDGAMSKVFKEIGHPVIETDISTGTDFFDTTFVCDAIITNPPFNESERFIKKALRECGFVAMLLKSQYWHAVKRLTLFEECPPTYVLPLTWRPDFLEHERKKGESGSPTMEVAWTVWNRHAHHQTMYQPLRKPPPNPPRL